MKIKQLHIHNIASIEDAKIDFDGAPLAQSEVFLITGNTGSGKSTILDAICLALFNDTPRMHHTEMEGNTRDGDNQVGIKDTRQMLRKNTAEGNITLTFEGNNGCPYTASWTVYRAYKKVSGRLQPAGWELTVTKAGKEQTFSKQADIRQEISEAVGLTFEQFCRTTMLAQGEFTRFLNSKDDEKAAILEKITGMDIYSKIGAKIYAETQRRKESWMTAKNKADAIAVLTDEEVEALVGEMKQLQQSYAEMKTLKEQQQAKQQWLETEAEKRKKVEETRGSLAKAQGVVESEEFRRWDTIVNQWNETIEARGWLSRQKETILRMERLKADSNKLSDRLRNLQAGAAWAEQQNARTEQEMAEMDAYLEQEKERKTVYEQADSVAIHLQTFIESQQEAADKAKEVARLQAKLQAAQKGMEEAQKAEAEKSEAYEEQKRSLEMREAELTDMNLPALRQENDAKKEIRRRIELTREHYARLQDIRQTRQQKETTLKQLQARITEEQTQLNELIPVARAAKQKKTECEEHLNRQKDTVNNFAKAIRSRLRVGDRCPVCQAEVTNVLQEAEFDELYAEAEKAFKASEQVLEELTNKYRTMEAHLKVDTETYNRERRLFDSDTSQKATEQTILTDYQTLQLDPQKGLQPLDELDRACGAAIATLEKRIADGEALDKLVREMRNTAERLQKDVQRLTEASLRKKEEREQCDRSIELARKEISINEERAKRAQEDISAVISPALWETDWRIDPARFQKELTAKAQQYQRSVTQRQSLGTALEQQRQTATLVRQALDEMEQTIPQELAAMGVEAPSAATMVGQPHHSATGFARQATTIAPHEVPNLLKSVNTLKSDVAGWCAQQREATTQCKELEEKLSGYYAANPTYDDTLLAQLNQIPQSDIAKTNERLQRCRTEVKTQAEMLAAAERELRAHLAAKPKMEEENEETKALKQQMMETLSQQILQLDNDLRLLDEERGKLMQRLQTNEANKKKRESLGLSIEKLCADYNRWNRMNNLIGCSTGKTFQKIAQSYVLESLIHTANAYMKTLTNRYTLRVVTGTFVILIEDAYQGYASRAASTLSGGESFLVSLSLALALSDIGHQFAVDTLFIDEGFGTLSGEPLQSAIATLRTLHKKNGRHVGIISHVEELKERIPVQIQVQQSGNSSSSKVVTVSI